MGTLAESRLIPSVASFRQFRADELADLAVLYISTLQVLFSNKDTKHFAEQYAKRTLQSGTDFSRWKNSGTDLYVIMHGLKANDIKLRDQKKSDKFKNIIPLGDDLVVRWLREISSGKMSSTSHNKLFTRLDFNFKIGNSSIRAVRRLVMDWDDLSHHERSLAVTRLIQLIRVRAQKGELLSELRGMAERHDLEIDDVCDKETGHGCAPMHTTTTSSSEKQKKGSSFLLSLASVAAGMAVASALSKKK